VWGWCVSGYALLSVSHVFGISNKFSHCLMEQGGRTSAHQIFKKWVPNRKCLPSCEDDKRGFLYGQSDLFCMGSHLEWKKV